jgi:hypothetical protein
MQNAPNVSICTPHFGVISGTGKNGPASADQHFFAASKKKDNRLKK